MRFLIFKIQKYMRYNLTYNVLLFKLSFIYYCFFLSIISYAM